MERAERAYDLQAAAELRYGKMGELETELKEAETQLMRLQDADPLLKEEVDGDEVATIIAGWTGIPVSRLMEGERERLLRIEEVLHRRVVGQEEAVRTVAAAIRRSRVGLNDPNRPVGSFIFLGPTGVGKTELARTLAEFLFDSEQNMVRIDMSEYQERHTVARLIGAPPGYVGYDAGGQLTEAVRRHPYSVVLFDEIEKAHPEIFNVLLQVLEDGRLTDSQGRTVDFRNTIVIMTSNLGSEFILDAEGESEAVERRVKEALHRHFRPEFLNRIDAAIVFRTLDEEELMTIIDIQLERMRELLKERGIMLEIADRARTILVEEGYDPAFGARPLKRVLQQRIADPLAEQLLEGHIHDRDHVLYDIVDGREMFTVVEQLTA